MVGRYRYEISDNGWAQIEDIVAPPQTMGRPRRDDRKMLNGIFWMLCSGAKWRDLPERYDNTNPCASCITRTSLPTFAGMTAIGQHLPYYHHRMKFLKRPEAAY